MLIRIGIKRKILLTNNNKKLLWISLTVFLLAYLFLVGNALYDDIFSQWNLNKFDLNNDGFFSGNELNEKQAKAMAALNNSIGRNLAFITGIFFALPLALLTYIIGLIIMKRKKTTHNNVCEK